MSTRTPSPSHQGEARERFEELLHQKEITGEELTQLLEFEDEVATDEEWQDVLMKVHLHAIPIDLHSRYVEKFKRHAPREDLFKYAVQVSELCIKSISNWEESEILASMLSFVAQLSLAMKDKTSELLRAIWEKRQEDPTMKQYAIRAEFVSELALAHSLHELGTEICTEAIRRMENELERELVNSRVRLAMRLYQFQSLLGKTREGLSSLQQIEENLVEADPKLADLFYTLQCQTHFQLQNWEEAKSMALKALEYATKSENKEAMAAHYANLSVIMEKLGDIEKAIEYRRVLIDDQKYHRDQRTTLLDKFALASLLESKGETKEAQLHFENLHEELKKTEFHEIKGAVFSRLAHSKVVNENDYGAAEQYLQRALEEYKKIEDTQSMISVLLALAEIYEFLGKMEEAKSHKDEAFELIKELRA